VKTANSLKFGWLPDSNTYETESIKIKPLDDFEEVISSISASGNIHEKWFYPPLRSIPKLSDELSPPVPSPWFALPETHQIVDKTNTDITGSLEFMILLFGWSQGLRLYPEGYGHHNRVATEIGMLTDFRICDVDVPKFLNLTEVFWKNHRGTGVEAGLFAAVHWYLYSCSYHQQFERFMYQYQVLDACFKVYCSMNGIKEPNGHYRRAKFLSDKLGLQVPSWAEPTTKGSRKASPIAELRNELLHEAKWAGEPIGYACLSDEYPNILYELKNFNCRLIAALLGISGSYVYSSSQTRHPRRLTF
jgi:hypothetical protein